MKVAMRNGRRGWERIGGAAIAIAARRLAMSVGFAGMFIVTGCKRDDMADQVKIKPLGASAYYADGAGRGDWLRTLFHVRRAWNRRPLMCRRG